MRRLAWLLPMLLLPLAGPAAAADLHRVCTVADPRIDESSGLLDRGDTMVTLNDEGGVLFVLDGRCRTVRTVSFRDTVDPEALAPAGRDAVWVADIGDNRAVRDSNALLRVPLDAGDSVVPERVELTYPDGAHDAETLLATPRGRLYVVTKEPFRSRVYAVPRRLGPGPLRLTRVATVDAMPTDGAVLADGRRAVLRDYAAARTYRLPSFAPGRAFALPEQRQGEGLSAGPGDRIRVSSEGSGQPVWQVDVPARPRATPSPASGSTPEEGSSRWPLLALAGAVLAAAVAGWALITAGIRGRRR